MRAILPAILALAIVCGCRGGTTGSATTPSKRLPTSSGFLPAAPEALARLEPTDRLISFGESSAQDAKTLSDRWQKIPAEKRERIVSYLLMRLGLSETGSIYLIGAYDQMSGTGRDEGGLVLHFQHLDLFGSRLFWSALVDPEVPAVRVLFHLKGKLITSEFAPIQDN
jgi:hypothetical protein